MTLDRHDYRRKIKTREELRALLGPRPRARTVIMCHGTFDLVHPGHIRHLQAASGKADILVASLTCDAHISKANHRPFVPQQLRAMNLAALEMVDFVLIDENSEPLENLRYLQPDFFAKGGEYARDGIHPRTRQEIAVLESYGGELCLTPCDVVFSSSQFIEQTPPNLSADKLAALMESEGLTIAALRQVVGSLAGIRVHVVGDTIVDSLVSCSLIGGIAKSLAPSLKHETQTNTLGGAAVVARHMRQAGARVVFSTVLGEDAPRDLVLRELREQGVECRPYIDPTRPTTHKTVFLADGQRVLKVNQLDNRPITDPALEHLTDSLASTPVDAAVFSDFRHGLFHRRTIPALTAHLPAGALTAADSQVASRWGNILDFEGFDLITPNEMEARFALGDQDSTIRPLALQLHQRARCKTLLLKVGDRGLLTCRAREGEAPSVFTVDSLAERVVDPVGAGDALLAYATLALVATRCPVTASILGSLAAAVICERAINHPVAPRDLLNKLDTLQQRMECACAS